MPVLAAASAIIGIASAGQLSSAIVLSELVPNKQRGPISGVVFLSSVPFVAFGPVIARSLSSDSTAGWRWAYYGGLIIHAVSLPLYYFCYYPPSFSQLHVGESLRAKLKSLDWTGMALFTVGWTLFMFGLLRGGAYYAWNTPAVICLLVIGFVMVIVFGVYG